MTRAMRLVWFAVSDGAQLSLLALLALFSRRRAGPSVELRDRVRDERIKRCLLGRGQREHRVGVRLVLLGRVRLVLDAVGRDRLAIGAHAEELGDVRGAREL